LAAVPVIVLESEGSRGTLYAFVGGGLKVRATRTGVLDTRGTRSRGCQQPLARHQLPVVARVHGGSAPYQRSLDAPLAAGPCRDDLWRRRRLKSLAAAAGVPASAAQVPVSGDGDPCDNGGSPWRRQQESQTAVAGVPCGQGVVSYANHSVWARPQG
jgi:hypothetical protein